MADTFEIDPGVFEIDAPQAMPGDDMPGFMRASLGGVEALGSIASGGLGAALGGLSGGVAGLASGDMAGRGGDVTRQVQDAMTYQPRTRAGQGILGAVAYPFQLYGRGAQAVSDAAYEATGSPAVGAAVNTGMQALPSVIAKGLKGPVRASNAAKKANLAGAASRNAVEDTTIAQARAEGLKVLPTDSTVGKIATGVGGRAETIRDLQQHNQPIIDRIARKEAGLGLDQPLTKSNLAAVRDKLSQPYRQVASLSSSAKSALRELEIAREKVELYRKEYATGHKVQTQERLQKWKGEASFWERYLEAEAKNAGKPDLIPQLRKAREALAKNHDVERALNVGNGHVDIDVLGRLLDKGEPLSGGLELLGKFQQATRSATASGGVAEGAAVGGVGHRLNTIMGAVSAPARSVGLSNMFQPKPSYQLGASRSLSDIATRRPELYMLGPTTGEQQQ